VSSESRAEDRCRSGEEEEDRRPNAAPTHPPRHLVPTRPLVKLPRYLFDASGDGDSGQELPVAVQLPGPKIDGEEWADDGRLLDGPPGDARTSRPPASFANASDDANRHIVALIGQRESRSARCSPNTVSG
jgi:hypothetical protein